MNDVEIVRDRLIAFYEKKARPGDSPQEAERQADLILSVITDGAYAAPPVKPSAD